MTLEHPKKAASESGVPAEFVSPHLEVEDLCMLVAEEDSIEHLSFTVHPNEIFGIFASEVRKTALFQALRGQGTLSAGTIRLLGNTLHPGSSVPERLLGVVPTPQHDLNTPGLNVTPREALKFHAGLLGFQSEKYQVRISATLDLVRLSSYDNLHVTAFPGGMRRRLSLARALLADPTVLLIDEPTSGIDEQELLGFWQCLRRMRDEQRKTLILLIGEWKEAQELCDRVLIVDACPPYQVVCP